MGAGTSDATVGDVKVTVVRSTRRRKTVQAREVAGGLQVSIPASMSKADEEHWVTEMVRRMQRRQGTAEIDLVRRAAELAGRYDLPSPTSIRWVDNQLWRWGSCTPSERSVRISSRLASEPGWVLDYVVVHELAHLVESGHGPRFWAVVNRYPRAERARGFLMARAMEPADDPAEPEDEVTDGADEPPAPAPVRRRRGDRPQASGRGDDADPGQIRLWDGEQVG